MGEREHLEVFKSKMANSILVIKTLISEMEDLNYLDSVKYPELYQLYLDWLDELNEISVRN